MPQGFGGTLNNRIDMLSGKGVTPATPTQMPPYKPPTGGGGGGQIGEFNPLVARPYKPPTGGGGIGPTGGVYDPTTGTWKMTGGAPQGLFPQKPPTQPTTQPTSQPNPLLAQLQARLQQALGGGRNSANNRFPNMYRDRMMAQAEPRFAGAMGRRGLTGSTAYGSGLASLGSDIEYNAAKLEAEQGSRGAANQLAWGQLGLQAAGQQANLGQQDWENQFRQQQFGAQQGQQGWANQFAQNQYENQLGQQAWQNQFNLGQQQQGWAGMMYPNYRNDYSREQIGYGQDPYTYRGRGWQNDPVYGVA